MLISARPSAPTATPCGFEWIWLLSVWQTGTASACIANESRVAERICPDAPRPEDRRHCGSGFAITGYTTSRARRRRRAGKAARADASARLKLMLDFVPNHMAIDHPWVDAHPDYFIAGTEHDLAETPLNYVRLRCERRAHLRARPRSVLRRVVRYAATRLQQSAGAGRHARHPRVDCRPGRWRSVRHGNARPARRLRSHMGPPA